MENNFKFPPLEYEFAVGESVIADIELCRKYVFKLLEDFKNPKLALHVPPDNRDWDIQLCAALDELESWRRIWRKLFVDFNEEQTQELFSKLLELHSKLENDD